MDIYYDESSISNYNDPEAGDAEFIKLRGAKYLRLNHDETHDGVLSSGFHVDHDSE